MFRPLTLRLMCLRSSSVEVKPFAESALWLQQIHFCRSIFVACCDGLTGFPQAIEAVYPQTQVQLCIVHLIRNCLRYVSWKDAKAVAADLKPIYQAAPLTEAELALDTFSEKWDQQYPTISQIWLRHWNNIIPFVSRNVVQAHIGCRVWSVS
jgi:transposase-like protein